MNWLRKFLGLKKEVDAAVKAAVEDTISAAEQLIPGFSHIRDEKAKEGVAEYKDGRDMVRQGTRKMEDGAEDVELAQKLGSHVKIRDTKLPK